MPELKNPDFIKNILDPRTGKQVKSVWELDRTSIKRPIRKLIWQYYKHRGIMSIETLYKKTYGQTLEFIYFNDHNIYEYVNNEPKIEIPII